MTDHLTWLANSTLHEMPDLEQGSEAWHDQRRGLVTASAIGQLITVGHLGAEGYQCPDCEAPEYEPCRSKVKRGGTFGNNKTHHAARGELARSKGQLQIDPADNDTSRGLTALLAAERITGYTEPTYMNDDMFRGVLDEPVARSLYSQHFAPAREVGFLVREGNGNGWKLGYSPDGLVGDDGLIEIKSRRQKKQLTTVLADEVPAENMAQIQCGLLVSGRKWLDYVSFSGGMHLWVKRVTPDPRWFDAIVQAVEIFEETVGEMVANYYTATEGLPMTERTAEEEIQI